MWSCVLTDDGPDDVVVLLQFSKLAKIEVGGTKGKTLTTSVLQIYSDFVQAVGIIRNVGYDIMDLDMKQFDDTFYEVVSASSVRHTVRHTVQRPTRGHT